MRGNSYSKKEKAYDRRKGKESEFVNNILQPVVQQDVTVVKNGLYRHYKDKSYEVIGEATHSESLEPMIVYRALYGKCGLWVRPKKMFLEKVLYNGKEVPRFSYMGEDDRPLIKD